MLDREPKKAAPKTAKKTPLSPEEEKVRQEKERALESGDFTRYPSKRRQNGWN